MDKKNPEKPYIHIWAVHYVVHKALSHTIESVICQHCRKEFFFFYLEFKIPFKEKDSILIKYYKLVIPNSHPLVCVVAEFIPESVPGSGGHGVSNPKQPDPPTL